VGLSADGGLTQLLLDPRTYQVIGMRSTSPGPLGHDLHKSAGGKDPRTLPPRGTVLESLSWTVTPVTGPGRS
jgi:hypothetical protein